MKSPKIRNSMGYICVKITFLSAKILYTEDLSNNSFNFSCENLPNFYFWNHKLFFTTQLVYIFFAQTLHTVDKNIPKKCNFFQIVDCSLLRLKFIKYIMSFFKQKVSFSLNFGWLFSVMRDNSSVLLLLKLYVIWTKGPHRNAKFQTFDCSRKISPNLYFDRLLKV